MKQLTLVDKSVFPEMLSRLTAPSAAGLMFGVGATAARLESDRKTQFTLRRIATLIMAAEEDTFAGQFDALRSKMEELFTATRVSSPSSTIRAELFMLVRAITLKSSALQVAPFWPTVSFELQACIASIAEEESEKSSTFAMLQAAKLLDLLLVIKPDEFQLHEWLFVTDTVDAIYPPDGWQSQALIDNIQGALVSPRRRSVSRSHKFEVDPTSRTSDERGHSLRRPWLSGLEGTRTAAPDDIFSKFLQPFFGQLSIHAFESTYSMTDVDLEACRKDLLADLFNDGTITSA